jgi:hypothetical protein
MASQRLTRRSDRPQNLARGPGKAALSEPEDLRVIQVIDIDPDIDHHSGSDILAVLLGVGHPVLRRICPARAVPQQQNCPRRRCLDSLTSRQYSGLSSCKCPRVPRTVVNLVEAAGRIGSDDALRPLAG